MLFGNYMNNIVGKVPFDAKNKTELDIMYKNQ